MYLIKKKIEKKNRRYIIFHFNAKKLIISKLNNKMRENERGVYINSKLCNFLKFYFILVFVILQFYQELIERKLFFLSNFLSFLPSISMKKYTIFFLFFYPFNFPSFQFFPLYQVKS